MYVPLAYSDSAERLNAPMYVTGYHGVGRFTNCSRLPADTLTLIDLAAPSPRCRTLSMF